MTHLSKSLIVGAGLYLHVPFCSAVCPYCDFAVTVGGPASRAAFVDSLLAEVALAAGGPEGAWEFDTVYLGGGTPSALVAEQLEQVLAAVAGALSLADDCRIFFEANPEDVTPAALAAWRALGVRTLSLGVQSFDVGALAFLGRRHTPADGRRSVELARSAGFDTVSLDLIYGLPGQEAATWRRDLEAAVALAPDHLSCYQLTVHDGTPFGKRRDRGELAELPEGPQAELFELTHGFLADAGYPAYEVSNFACAPEHRSRHNSKYWDHTPYLGLGPSAHSFSGLPAVTGDQGRRGLREAAVRSGAAGAGVPATARRWWNERRLAPYRTRLARGDLPVAGEERLDPTELALERLMLALRTVDGLDLDDFLDCYGVDLEATNAERLEDLRAAGLLGATARLLRPTRRGLAVADGLAARFQI